MPYYFARIERANGRSIDQVEIRVTVENLSSGRQSWSGEFLSRSKDGFQPDEQFRLVLNNGQAGTASVSRTHFDSRAPEGTRVEFTGLGPLQ